jgi:cytochrome c-type biogenesis protein CcmH
MKIGLFLHQGLKPPAKPEPSPLKWTQTTELAFRVGFNRLGIALAGGFNPRRKNRFASLHLCAIAFILFLSASIALAQDAPVTDDDVNAVAGRLYCPVCENIPLDTCPTEACARWREEIRVQLENGSTPDQVVADFVSRFGERAIGTPLDPTLRALSLVTPYALAGLALIIGVWTFIRWRRRPTPTPSAPNLPAADADNYRAILERDLSER